MRAYARLLFAGAVALTLTACGDEETAENAQPPANPPAANEPPATTEVPRNAERDEALNKLREGSRSIAEGAGALLEQGREAAGRALEDAGPVLRKAEDFTRELGRIAQDTAERAAADLRNAAEMLNRRIEESDRQNTVPEGDQQARLAAIDLLHADTRAAARARPAGVGPDYVGVWAGEASQCGRIDQEPVERFAVITPTTIRRYESVCNFESVPLSDGTATVAASCIAEGKTEQRQITLSVPSPDTLEIGSPGSPMQATLVRCHLGG